MVVRIRVGLVNHCTLFLFVVVGMIFILSVIVSLISSGFLLIVGWLCVVRGGVIRGVIVGGSARILFKARHVVDGGRLLVGGSLVGGPIVGGCLLVRWSIICRCLIRRSFVGRSLIGRSLVCHRSFVARSLIGGSLVSWCCLISGGCSIGRLLRVFVVRLGVAVVICLLVLVMIIVAVGHRLRAAVVGGLLVFGLVARCGVRRRFGGLICVVRLVRVIRVFGGG